MRNGAHQWRPSLWGNLLGISKCLLICLIIAFGIRAAVVAIRRTVDGLFPFAKQQSTSFSGSLGRLMAPPESVAPPS